MPTNVADMLTQLPGALGFGETTDPAARHLLQQLGEIVGKLTEYRVQPQAAEQVPLVDLTRDDGTGNGAKGTRTPPPPLEMEVEEVDDSKINGLLQEHCGDENAKRALEVFQQEGI